jgi:lysophospholipase L1-like esterase
LLVAPVPILETGVFTEIFAGGAAKSRALPGPLRAVAQRLGTDFADLSEVAQVDPEDGIHLDAAAHAAIGAALAERVRASFG